MAREAQGHRPAVVFLGPTLSHAEARGIVDAVYLPPAVQGSVVFAVQRFDPGVILIVDGSFQAAPAVRHKEILWALSLGIPVAGAASMGALRAAELFPYMQGVGLVYRWYRRFAFAPDDAVAVLHGPPEVNSPPLTLAEIDLRLTFRAAARRGLISGDVRARLDDAARGLNFRDRTLKRVVAEAFPHGDGRTIAAWTGIFESAPVEQKKRDAVLALRLLGSGAFAAPPAPVNFTPTAAFVRDIAQSGASMGLQNI